MWWILSLRFKQMKTKQPKMILFRQGDVLFTRVATLPVGEKRKRDNATVAYGEVTGHSHQLAVEDRNVAEVLECGDGLFVHVSAEGLRCEGGATFLHEEHGPITLPVGDWKVTIQREYSPEAIRDVQD